MAALEWIVWEGFILFGIHRFCLWKQHPISDLQFSLGTRRLGALSESLSLMCMNPRPERAQGGHLSPVILLFASSLLCALVLSGSQGKLCWPQDLAALLEQLVVRPSTQNWAVPVCCPCHRLETQDFTGLKIRKLSENKCWIAFSQFYLAETWLWNSMKLEMKLHSLCPYACLISLSLIVFKVHLCCDGMNRSCIFKAISLYADVGEWNCWMQLLWK